MTLPHSNHRPDSQLKLSAFVEVVFCFLCDSWDDRFAADIGEHHSYGTMALYAADQTSSLDIDLGPICQHKGHKNQFG